MREVLKNLIPCLESRSSKSKDELVRSLRRRSNEKGKCVLVHIVTF